MLMLILGALLLAVGGVSVSVFRFRMFRMVFDDKVVKGIAAAMARQEITNATINGDEFVMNQKGTELAVPRTSVVMASVGAGKSRVSMTSTLHRLGNRKSS